MTLTLPDTGITTFSLAFLIVTTCQITRHSMAQSFEEVSSNAGVTHFQHDPYLITGGVAVFDFNNDGYDDLYFTGGLREDRLYENDGTGSFIDVSDRLDSDLLKSAFTQGVAVGDIDNDGFDDIFVTTHKGYGNILMINHKGERFIDVSGRLKSPKRNVWSTSASMTDVDMDGDLDIYVGNFVDYDTEKFRDESISATIPNTLYINNNGSFTDEAEAFGVANEGSTLAVSFTDANDDGYPDIYVGNDHGKRFSPNALYLNRPLEGFFERIPAEMGADVAINSMGIAIGDYDEDEDLDYYITHISDNVLLNNHLKNASGFTDESVTESVQSTSGVSWGAVFFDYDNDTNLDLYVANGDMFGVDIPQKNVLYQRKNGTFSNVGDAQKVSDVTRCRGVAYGDLDNDGMQDLVVVAVSAEDDRSVHNAIYHNKNTSSRYWTKIQLEGTESNRNAYGSLVKLFAGDRAFIREVDGGSSYLSHNSSTLHIGLGQYQHIDSLQVRWPGGKRELYRSLDANRLIYVRENDDIYYMEYEVHEKECEKDSIMLFDAYRTLPGIYRDTIQNNEVREIRTATLKAPRRKLTQCNTTSEKPGSKEVSIYPNPSVNEITIAMNTIKDYDLLVVNIINLTGETVLEVAIQPDVVQNDTVTIPNSLLEKLGPGLYLMNIHSPAEPEKPIISKRIMRH